MALENTAQPLEYQKRINGIVYGYSNITFSVSPSGSNGIALPFFELQDINYTWTNERQELGGTSPVPIGYTSGHLNFKGNFGISFEEDEILMETLVSFAGGLAGVSRIPFDITLDYGPLPGVDRTGKLRFIRDVLYGCLINDGDNSHSRGNALTVKHNIVFTNFSRNGISMI